MQTVSRKQAKRFKQLAAAGAITLTLAGSAVQAASPAFAADEESTTNANAGGVNNKGLKVTPDATDLNKAVKEAQDAGLTVDTKTEIKDVKVSDIPKEKQSAEQGYATQAKEIREKTAEYNNKMAEYKKLLSEYEATASKVPTDRDDSNQNGLNLNGGVSKNKDWRFMMSGSRDDVRNATLTVVANKSMSAKEAEHHYLKKGSIIRWNDNTQMTQEKGKTGSKYDGSIYDNGGSVVLTNVGILQDGTNVNVRLTGDKSFLVAPHEPNQDGGQRTGKIIVDSQDDLNLKIELLDDNGDALSVWQGNFFSDIDIPNHGYEQNIDFKNAQENGIAIVDNNLNVLDGYTLRAKKEGDNHDSNKFSIMTVTYGKSNSIRIFNSGPVKSDGYEEHSMRMITPLFGQQLNVDIANPPAKPEKPQISAKLTSLNYQPEVVKDVDAGTNKANIDGSANGKTFIVGDKMTFTFQTTTLPAGRETYKTLAYTDELPDGFKFADAKAFDKDGKDVSDQVKVTEKDGKLTVAFTDAAIKAINADTKKDYILPTITVHGTAAKDGAKLTNTVSLDVDGQPFKSNKVEPVVKDIAAHKNVEAGMKDTATGESVNGKAVVKGQALTYELTTDDLPANRATNVTKFAWSDELPKYVDFAGFKVVNAAGEDVTDQYENTGDGKRKFAINLKSVDALNADKTKAYKTDTVLIYTNANQDGVNFKNTAKLTLSDQGKTTETVENRTPNYHPEKKDVDEKGNSIDGKNVKPGDTIHYQIVGDLTDMTDIALSKDAINEQTFGLSDDYDETRLDVTDAVQKDFNIELVKPETESTDDKAGANKSDDKADANKSDDKADANNSDAKADAKDGDTIFIEKGTATKFDMNDVDVNWDLKNGKWTVTPKDQLSFLQKYAGYEIVANFNPIVKDGATGVIENVATQTTFGDDKETNKVKNPISEHNVIEKTTEVKEKQLPNTGSNGPLQRVVNWFMGLAK